jgi:hypothetical protein
MSDLCQSMAESCLCLPRRFKQSPGACGRLTLIVDGRRQDDRLPLLDTYQA